MILFTHTKKMFFKMKWLKPFCTCIVSKLPAPDYNWLCLFATLPNLRCIYISHYGNDLAVFFFFNMQIVSKSQVRSHLPLFWKFVVGKIYSSTRSRTLHVGKCFLIQILQWVQVKCDFALLTTRKLHGLKVPSPFFFIYTIDSGPLLGKLWQQL